MDGSVGGFPVGEEMDVATVASKVRTGERRDEVMYSARQGVGAVKGSGGRRILRPDSNVGWCKMVT